MIQLEIIESPDREILGDYITYRNDLIIGRSTSADLPIDDSKLDEIHALIRLLPTHLYIRTVPGSSSFLLNGKKFAGEKKIKCDEHLTIGDTKIIIKKILFDPASSPGDFKDYYKKTINKYPETGILLEVLEREIANLSTTERTKIHIK